MNAYAIVRLIRPWQWLKNLMLFFPPMLSGAMSHPGSVGRGVLPFIAFCLASSASYIFNDLIDQQKDALHPVKKDRPIPSGKVSRGAAIGLSGLLLFSSLLMSWHVSMLFLLLVVIYLLLIVCYSLWLKNRPILDIFCIAIGFVLRLCAGGVAFQVMISDWLFLTVFLLAIFLSVGKRYSERRALGKIAGEHRQTLKIYPDGFLEGAMYLSGSSVLVTYSIYSISTPMLVYTVPVCMYGLLRYLMRIQAGQSGDPSESLIRDIPLLLTSVLWLLMVGWSVYR